VRAPSRKPRITRRSGGRKPTSLAVRALLAQVGFRSVAEWARAAEVDVQPIYQALTDGSAIPESGVAKLATAARVPLTIVRDVFAAAYAERCAVRT
jgi:hypothetical protein